MNLLNINYVQSFHWVMKYSVFENSQKCRTKSARNSAADFNRKVGGISVRLETSALRASLISSKMRLFYFFKTLWSVWIWQAQFVLQVFCLFYLIGGISLTNGTAVKTILVISSLYVEKHSFKINILSKRIPWNFTQFDRMLRMQIFCTYDELMGVQKFRRSASQYKYNS